MTGDRTLAGSARRRILKRARAKGILVAQGETRRNLTGAALEYVALREATGSHEVTVPAFLRDGTPVVAIVTVNLVPDPE